MKTRPNLKRTSIVWLLPLALLSLISTPGRAECSDRHIRALDKSGRSVSQIQQICRMTKEDILAALALDDSDTEESPPPTLRQQGLPSGFQLTSCGCWGSVNPGASLPNASCASGVEHPVACGGFCPAGGLPWARVCF